MSFYKAIFQYNGAKYYGWQIQPRLKTVQGTINKTLEKISKSKIIKTLGSGRTDAGVHALCQVVKIEIPLVILPESLKNALNANLPSDIRCISLENCTEIFRPINDCVWKEYTYIFSNNKNPNPFQSDFLPNYFHKIDTNKILEASELFIGEHDFKNFFCKGTPVNSTIRTIYGLDFKFIKSDNFLDNILPPHYKFVVRGNGFLKQMVRLIVGSLLEIGRGKTNIEMLRYALQHKMDKKLGPVAPASGLYLTHVEY